MPCGCQNWSWMFYSLKLGQLYKSAENGSALFSRINLHSSFGFVCFPFRRDLSPCVTLLPCSLHLACARLTGPSVPMPGVALALSHSHCSALVSLPHSLLRDGAKLTHTKVSES